MNPIKVTDDIFKLTVGVKDLLFEEMWYLPNGVTLNSYIVKGDKVAIIDGFCAWDGVPEKLFAFLAKMELTIEDLDYLIINHMEPDHSGWLEKIVELKPNVEILCTKMASNLLEGFFGIKENVRIIKMGDKIDLGAGKVLEFMPMAHIHWPDTMLTLEHSTQTLFTCDFYGTYGTCENKDFDDNFKEDDIDYFTEEAIRYFSNILVTYTSSAEKAIKKTRELAPKIIAPGHGPVWRKDCSKIVDIYNEITNWNKGNAKDEVLILWGSMYGMTEIAVKHAEEILSKRSIKFKSLRMPQTPIGTVMSYAIRSKAIIIAAPVYENHIFPAVGAAVEEILKKKISSKKALYMGSYGWAPKGDKELLKIAERLKSDWEFLDPIAFKARPSDDVLTKIEQSLQELI